MGVIVNVPSVRYTTVVNDTPRTAAVTVNIPGPAGPGVPAGGTTGQILAKASGSDFDTHWIIAPTGGGTGGTTYDDTEIRSEIALKADQTSLDAHTGDVSNPHAVTKAQVGLGNADNTSDLAKPVSTATQTALDGKAATVHTHTASQISDFAGAVDTRVQLIVGAAPAALDTLSELASALGNDANFASTVTTSLAGKEPTITAGTTGQFWRGDKSWVSIDKSTIGLSNVDNTADAAKPVSTATQTALNAKEPTIAGGTTTQFWRGDKTWVIVDKSTVGLANVDNTADANKPVSAAQQTALNAKENSIAAGTTAQFWRGDKTWTAIDKTTVGLGNVDNTSDLNKPVSTATQTALNAKAPLASPTFTGTVGGVTKSMVGLANVDNTSDTSKPISTATQTALDAKAPIASPTFTGTVGGVTKAMVGLSNVDNTADTAKPVSTAQQAALNTKENSITAGTTAQFWRGDKTWASIDKTTVGLANVDNTADTAKPVSSAQQTALNGKANTVHQHVRADITDIGSKVVMSTTAPTDTTVVWIDIS